MENILADEIENTILKISRNEAGKRDIEKRQDYMIGEFQKDLKSLSSLIPKLEKGYGTLLDINLRLETDNIILSDREGKFFQIIKDSIEPLETITGFFKIMSRFPGSLTQTQVEEFSIRMDTAVKDVLLKLENLLKWSMVQIGSVKYEPVTINVGKSIQESIGFFELIAKRKDIIIRFEDGHNLNVKADPNMFNYIMKNLISNSIKFSYRGSQVRINVRKVDELVEIKVEDDGVGMEESLSDNLFKDGHQFTTEGTEHERGCGLGLLPIKELIKKNQGDIFIKSAPKHGTIVGFTLPVAISESNKKIERKELVY